MKPILFLLILLLPAGVTRGATPRDHARRAQALLGPGVWSRVIRVENSARHGPYPSAVYALVFEMGGILWFYTDTNGTQSLSRLANHVAEDRRDFGPLLRRIAPGFGAYAVLAEPPGAPAAGGELPNGCFIECLAALSSLAARGERITNAHLLSYYCDTIDGRRGHTVLVYRTSDGWHGLDPEDPAHPLALGRTLATDALTAARVLPGAERAAQARWVPAPVPHPAELAAAGTARRESRG